MKIEKYKNSMYYKSYGICFCSDFKEKYVKIEIGNVTWRVLWIFKRKE